MKPTRFYIGKFKNGQDFASVVDYFGHDTKEEAVQELINMYDSVELNDDHFDSGLSEENLREHMAFTEDTTNWGIFELAENEYTGELEEAITKSWGGRNFTSNQL